MLSFFILADIYGIPFTAYRGVYKKEQAEAFQNLSLVADMKKERLVRWMDERISDACVLAENRLTCKSIASLIPIVNERASSGIKGKTLLTELQQEEMYNMLTHQLSLVNDTYGVYEKAVIIDILTHVVIASTHKADLGMKISMQNSFNNILHKGSHDAIIIKQNQINGNLELLVSHAIFSPDDEYTVTSILIMHINPDDLIKPMLHTGGGLGDTGEALLVNYDAKILTKLKYPLADGTIALPLQHQIKAKPAVLAAQGEEGIITTKDYRGKQVLAAYRHARLTSELGWGLVVKRDLSEVFAPVRESLYYRIIIGCIAAVIMFILTTLIARSLTIPIQNLNKAVLSMGEGNMDVYAQITTKDEVGTLARSFNTMVQSLQEAREKLVAKEKFSTIGRISGAIAHDVRHPLATIKNSAYFLNMTLKDPNDKTKKHLNLINSEVIRANEIITGLMRLSEVRKPEKDITSVTDLLNEFLTSFNLPDKIKLITEFDSTCPDILIDQLQIKQVFANLASNAVRAMSEEGTLTVKTLRVKCSGDKGDLVEVLFNDTGCGIKKDILAKIFEAFYTTRSSGMGLGLSIVKDIVNANGGEIIVESEEGKGSIFKITFPGVLTG